VPGDDDEIEHDDDPEHERIGLQRERVTMELYTSITLLAGLYFAHEGWEEEKVFGLVWGTTLGLAAAHWFAFSMANKLVDPTRDRSLVLRELKAQLAGAAIVGAWASVAIAIAGDDHARVAAQIAVVSLIGYVVVRLGRSYGQPWRRCIWSAVVAVLVAGLIAGFKEGLLE
jgi:hypothetical protein